MAVRLQSELGWALSLLHDDEGALEQYHAVEKAIQEQVVEDPIFHLNMLLWLGSLYTSQGDIERGIAILVQAAEVAEDVRQLELLGSAYWSISQARAQRGDAAGTKDYAAMNVVWQLGDAYAQFPAFLERYGESKRAFEMLKQALTATRYTTYL